jgi:hypothetical protein
MNVAYQPFGRAVMERSGEKISSAWYKIAAVMDHVAMFSVRFCAK